MYSPSFEPAVSHQSGTDEMLKRSASRNIRNAGLSAIKTLKPFIGFIADVSEVTARHLPIKAHVPFQQVSRDQIIYSRSCPSGTASSHARGSGWQLAKVGESSGPWGDFGESDGPGYGIPINQEGPNCKTLFERGGRGKAEEQIQLAHVKRIK